jgi:hypothetical protein
MLIPKRWHQKGGDKISIKRKKVSLIQAQAKSSLNKNDLYGYFNCF